MEGSNTPDANSPEVKSLQSAFRALLTGNQAKADQLFTEAKAMSAGSDPDGGYVVHSMISSGMTKVMAEISPMYRLARKVSLDSGDSFEEPVDKDSAAASWIGEVSSRSDTDTPQLANFRVPLDEIYALPKVSQKLLDVAGIDVMAWLTSKVADAFAVKEGTGFHTGTGVGQPRGILTYTTAATADASRTWGEFEHVVTGTSADFNTTTKADCLIDVAHKLKSQYRAGAVWLMNRNTLAKVRKLKEATSDQYIWIPGLSAGQPDTMLGHEIHLDEDMPDIGASTLSIAFGNFQRGYTIIERPGVKYITDNLTDKPNVKLYGYRRVGAGANDFNAIKFVKFSA